MSPSLAQLVVLLRGIPSAFSTSAFPSIALGDFYLSCPRIL